MVERTEKEGDKQDDEKKEGLGFAFAQIWSAEKDTLEEVQDEGNALNEQDDSWTQTLAVSFLFEISGRFRTYHHISASPRSARRYRRKKCPVEVSAVERQLHRRYPCCPFVVMQPLLTAAEKPIVVDFEDTPVRNKGASKIRSKSTISDESDAYTGSGLGGSDGEDTDDTGYPGVYDLDTLTEPPPPAIKGLAAPSSSKHPDTGPLSLIHNMQRHDGNDAVSYCGLCGTAHGDGACYMTESSNNLAEYRQMLILHADDEPVEERVSNFLKFLSEVVPYGAIFDFADSGHTCYR